MLRGLASLILAMAMLSRLTPAQALLISLLAAIATIGFKLAAWHTTGSVGFLSDAIEALVNLIAAGFALAMVVYARTPPDPEHPYGHGKAEYFSAAFEGTLIFAAALAIGVAATERLFNPQAPMSLGLGTILATVASAINLATAAILLRVGRAHRSVALEADARHLLTDVWTTAGVIVGVALAGLTGYVWLDPLVALAVALHILREGWRLLSLAAQGLMDRALSTDEIATLRAALEALLPAGCAIATLRTRSSGHNRFADLELRVPGEWSVTRAHDLADVLELELARQGFLLNTHIEPLDPPNAKRQD